MQPVSSNGHFSASRPVRVATGDQDSIDPANPERASAGLTPTATGARAVSSVEVPCFYCCKDERGCLHSRVPCDRCAVRLALEAAE